MRKVDKLKREARETAHWRGHNLAPFARFRGDLDAAHSRCTRCGRTVYVDPRPPANGVDISGEAVAVDCDRFCVTN